MKGPKHGGFASASEHLCARHALEFWLIGGGRATILLDHIAGFLLLEDDALTVIGRAGEWWPVDPRDAGLIQYALEQLTVPFPKTLADQ